MIQEAPVVHRLEKRARSDEAIDEYAPTIPRVVIHDDDPTDDLELGLLREGQEQQLEVPSGGSIHSDDRDAWLTVVGWATCRRMQPPGR